MAKPAQERGPRFEHPVVVGYDGSRGADAALDWATKVALQERMPMVIVAAWSSQDDPGTGAVVRRLDVERAAAEAAHRVHTVLGRDQLVAIDVVQGRPGDVLLERSPRAGLLVLGTHGRVGAMGALLGSVSRMCVRYAACPVALVREHVAAGPPRRLLVLGEECAGDDELFDWAARTSVELGAELHVLDVRDGQAAVDVLRAGTGPGDVLALGRAAGPLPSVVVRGARCPLVVVPTTAPPGRRVRRMA